MGSTWIVRRGLSLSRVSSSPFSLHGCGFLFPLANCFIQSTRVRERVSCLPSPTRTSLSFFALCYPQLAYVTFRTIRKGRRLWKKESAQRIEQANLDLQTPHLALDESRNPTHSSTDGGGHEIAGDNHALNNEKYLEESPESEDNSETQPFLHPINYGSTKSNGGLTGLETTDKWISIAKAAGVDTQAITTSRLRGYFYFPSSHRCTLLLPSPQS